MRLDYFLSTQIPEYSRTKIQLMIQNGNVKVDGINRRSSFKLSGGETISLQIEDLPSEVEHLTSENIPLNILYEDDEIIGVNKPAGLVVHPGVGNKSGTLVNGLIHHFKSLSTINGTLRPGIIHRLDKDTSGVMIVAKTDEAHSACAKQFSMKSVKKKYLGITWGLWEKKTGIIETKISRKKSDPTLFEVASEYGKSSVTEFNVVEEGRYYSAVNFVPKTGRTHQIRVHSTYQNHPIIGDNKYGGGASRIRGFIPEVQKIFKREIAKMNRHALHSEKICFNHPLTKEEIEITAPIPNAFNKLLDQFRENNL